MLDGTYYYEERRTKEKAMILQPSFSEGQRCSRIYEFEQQGRDVEKTSMCVTKGKIAVYMAVRKKVR